MLQLWLIALVAIIYIHEELPGSNSRAELSPATIAAVLGPYLALALIVHLVCRFSAREIDRRGSHRALRAAERVLAVSRPAVVATHAAAVFSLGWVEQARALTHDQFLLTTLLALLPPVLTIMAGWWSYYPIERRLREGMWVRVLEEGRPAYPTPTRWQFLWSNFRHQVLFVLVPVLLIGTWSHLWSAAINNRNPGVLGDAARLVWKTGFSKAIEHIGQFAGVLVVLAFAPLAMRFVWDAVPLGPGTLRDRLLAVCSRAGVKVRQLLVWRTHGTMLNGAAMGLAAPLRYILLTDALLDQLPERQVESVMAHEVGHAKYHHIPWLMGGLLATVGVTAAVLGIGLFVVEPFLALFVHSIGLPVGVVLQTIYVIASILMLALAFTVFGWISRRFEWQADAFAAKQSGGVGSGDPPGDTITAESVESMCGALESVAQLNHIPVARGSFRHGSIAERQRRLRTLIGIRRTRAPIDATCRRIKSGIIVGVLMVVAALALEGLATALFARRDIPSWVDPKDCGLEDAPR